MRPRLVLASASPRRLELLHAAGFDPHVIESDLDDGELRRPDIRPEAFVVAASWFKASRIMKSTDTTATVVLAADTMCVCGVDVLGKPRDERDARSMIRALGDRSHRTVTGVSVVEPDGRRHLFVDVAEIEIGRLDQDAIDAYVVSGEWRGKAGGYNYAERIAAGWPVACEGDPTSVMGLPMSRVIPLLESFGVQRIEPLSRDCAC